MARNAQVSPRLEGLEALEPATVNRPSRSTERPTQPLRDIWLQVYYPYLDAGPCHCLDGIVDEVPLAFAWTPREGAGHGEDRRHAHGVSSAPWYLGSMRVQAATRCLPFVVDG